MKPGDKVEVHEVWAAGGWGRAPLTHWAIGYELISITGDKVVVKVLEGMYEGCHLNYSLSDIRPATGDFKGVTKYVDRRRYLLIKQVMDA
jgi:hypothetical protein